MEKKKSKNTLHFDIFLYSLQYSSEKIFLSNHILKIHFYDILWFTCPAHTFPDAEKKTRIPHAPIKKIVGQLTFSLKRNRRFQKSGRLGNANKKHWIPSLEKFISRNSHDLHCDVSFYSLKYSLEKYLRPNHSVHYISVNPSVGCVWSLSSVTTSIGREPSGNF